MPDPIKVLYIVGWKRSGSTILGNVLGEMSGFWHAGELRTVWGAGLLHGRLCGCGKAVSECDFWSDILATVASRTGHPGPDRVYAWQRDGVRTRYMRTLLKRAPLDGDERLGAYARVTTSLFRAVAEKTGARVIVDSSKQPADAALLGRLPEIDPFFIQLVRDPRAVAHSWRRQKASPGEGRRQQMMQVSPGRSTASWLFVDLAAELIRRHFGPDRTMMVRYEDFVSDPRSVLDSVATLVGEPTAVLPEIVETSIRLNGNHTAGGNPGRFKSGWTELRADDEWTKQQPRRDRVVATLVALPLLQRYRYPIRTHIGTTEDGHVASAKPDGLVHSNQIGRKDAS